MNKTSSPRVVQGPAPTPEPSTLLGQHAMLLDASGALPILVTSNPNWNGHPQVSALILVDATDYERVMDAQPWLIYNTGGDKGQSAWNVIVSCDPATGEPKPRYFHGKRGTWRTLSHWLLDWPVGQGQVAFRNGNRFDCRRSNIVVKVAPKTTTADAEALPA